MDEEERLYFIDATHPTKATKITNGGIKTGVDKPIETSESRTPINLIGVIAFNAPEQAIVKPYEYVNKESIMDFLSKIKETHPTISTLYVVLDGADYHSAKEIIEKVETLKIQLHYLPPYSPNLNPIERLWKVMNAQVRNNQYFSTAQEFRRQILSFFEFTAPTIKKELSCRITDNFPLFDFAT